MTNQGSIHLIGWVLFVISALAFITSSLRSGDTAGLIGGGLFLAGCLTFLIPYIRRDSEG